MSADRFSTTSLANAQSFCRSLTARGYSRQRTWEPLSEIPRLKFRTYVYGRRLLVMFASGNPSGRKLRDKSTLAPRCQSEDLTCMRPRAYLSGRCANCEQRHRYAMDEAFRERKRVNAKRLRDQNKKRSAADPAFLEELRRREREKRERQRRAKRDLREAA